MLSRCGGAKRKPSGGRGMEVSGSGVLGARRWDNLASRSARRASAVSVIVAFLVVVALGLVALVVVALGLVVILVMVLGLVVILVVVL